MRSQIEVCAISDTFELFQPMREAIHDVHGGFRVVSQFVSGDVIQLKVVLIHALLAPPLEAFCYPGVVPVFYLILSPTEIT